MSLPSVSIIMPAFNRQNFIAAALKSAQLQPAIEAEIIVVDDGSADETIAVVNKVSASDRRVRLIENAHGGVSKARNAGLRAARGDFITFLDSDDLYAPNRLHRQIRKLQMRPEVTLVTGHNQMFSSVGDDLTPILDVNSYRRTDPSLGSAVFPRSLFDKFGFFDESMDMGEDLDFFLRLFEADARILVEVETVYFIRRHERNMTNDEPAMYRGVLQAYQKSIHRRKQAGRSRRLDVFFHRPFDREVLIGGSTYDS